MMRLENELTIFKSDYIMLIKTYDTKITFEVITDIAGNGTYKIYEGVLRCRSISNNEERIKKFFIKMLNHFEQSQKIDISFHDMTVKYPLLGKVVDQKQKYNSVLLKEKIMTPSELIKLLFFRQLKIYKASEKKDLKFAQNLQKFIEQKINKSLQQNKINENNQLDLQKSSSQTYIVDLSEEADDSLGAPKKKVKLTQCQSTKMQPEGKPEQKNPVQAPIKQNQTNKAGVQQRKDERPINQQIPISAPDKVENLFVGMAPQKNKQTENKNTNSNGAIDPRLRARKTVQKQQPRDFPEIIDDQKQSKMKNQSERVKQNQKQFANKMQSQSIENLSKPTQNQSQKSSAVLQENTQKSEKIQSSPQPQIQSSSSSIESKWLVSEQNIKNFLLCGNYVKYSGQNLWSHMALNHPMTKDEGLSVFEIRITESKFNCILVGVTAMEGISAPCEQHHLVFNKRLDDFHRTDLQKCKLLTARFNEGDIVKVLVDWKNSRIQWKINKNPVSVIVQQLKNIKNKTLYPCIEMFKQNDIIEWLG